MRRVRFGLALSLRCVSAVVVALRFFLRGRVPHIDAERRECSIGGKPMTSVAAMARLNMGR